MAEHVPGWEFLSSHILNLCKEALQNKDLSWKERTKLTRKADRIWELMHYT